MKSVLIGVGSTAVSLWAVWLLFKVIEIGTTLYEIRDLLKERR